MLIVPRPLGVPVIAGLGVATSRDDWVVRVTLTDTTVRQRYANASAERDAAVSAVVAALGVRLNEIESITAQRRHEVEPCAEPSNILSRLTA